MNRKYCMKLCGVSIFVVIGFVFLNSHQVSAITPNDIPYNMRDPVANLSTISGYNNNCPSVPQKYFLASWVGQGGNPSNNVSVTVPSGTTNVSLESHGLVFVCRDRVTTNSTTYPNLPNDGTPYSVALEETRMFVNDLSGTDGTISPGIVGSTRFINRTYASRYWFPATGAFTYISNTPLTTTKNITVSGYITYINDFGSGDVCVGRQPDPPAPPNPTHRGCASSFVSYTIQIIVEPPPTVNVQGRVFDAVTGAVVSTPINIETCGGRPLYSTVLGPGANDFNVSINVGAGFCIRPASFPAGYVSGKYSVRPAIVGYPGVGCPAGSTCTGDPGYENQIAGQAPGGADRTIDIGYDLVLYPDQPPIGNIDTANCTQGVIGWAGDRDSLSTSLKVHLYLDAPYGSPGWRSVGIFDANSFSEADIEVALGAPPPGSPGNHRFVITPSTPAQDNPGTPDNESGRTLSQFNDYASHNVYIYLIGVDSSGSPSGLNTLLGSPGVTDGTIEACAVPTCGSASTNPSPIEVGNQFDVSASFNYAPGALGRPITNPPISVRIDIPGIGTNNNVPYAPDPASSNFIATWSGIPAPTATGSYAINVSLLGIPGGDISCGGIPPTFLVITKPYFRVYGGDVAAGSAFLTDLSCTPSSSDESIIAWNKGAAAGGDYAGAGTQLLAFATAPIQDFVSAQLRGSWPGPPKGLSFANDKPVNQYGGDLANAAGCIDNYFSRIPASDSADDLALASTVGRHKKPTGLVLNDLALGNLTGRKLTIYVDGDVIIDGNISYPSIYNSLDEVPMLRIVARRIYISPAATDIDAILIAQPRSNGTEGIIYTCSDGGTVLPTVESIASDTGACRTRKLTINGALIARKIELLRSVGTLNNSTIGEGSTSANIAEVVNFTPEAWIVNPINDSGGPGAPEYDDFTGLPPAL